MGGQPLACPLQLQEERTQFFQLLCRKLSPPSCRLFLYALLSGRPLKVQGDQRDQVLSCLDLVLPGPLRQQLPMVIQPAWATLIVKAASAKGDPPSDVSLTCQACSCCAMERALVASSTVCVTCGAANTSTLVARWTRIVRSDQLSVAAQYMRMVTAVAEAVVQARAWRRLRSPADKRDFLKKLGFARSDGEILDLYNLII